MSRSTLPALSVVHYFTNLTDPRLRRRRRHNFLDIIVICGTICGCKSWNEIAIYGRKKTDWLQTFLELPNGIPARTRSAGCLPASSRRRSKRASAVGWMPWPPPG